MDPEMLRELNMGDPNTISAIEYAQRCIEIYEETIRAMGLFLPENASQAIEDSHLVYLNPADLGAEYANV
jgi:hypothetical protein